MYHYTLQELEQKANKLPLMVMPDSCLDYIMRGFPIFIQFFFFLWHQVHIWLRAVEASQKRAPSDE